MLNWFVYIIYSKRIDRYYTGYTKDILLRVQRHNEGWGNYSSKGIPWELKYFETFTTKSAAINREREIKNKKSRKYIEKLIEGGRPD